MWQKISEDLNNILDINRSDMQCENRYKTILKRKKKAIDNNRTSGSSRMDLPFESEINKIAAIDDSIEPEVREGVGRVVLQERENINNLETPKKKRSSVHEARLELGKMKEENRERRHQEKLKMSQALIDALKEN